MDFKNLVVIRWLKHVDNITVQITKFKILTVILTTRFFNHGITTKFFLICIILPFTSYAYLR